MNTFGYGKAIDQLLKGMPVRRTIWPARNYLKTVQLGDTVIFVKITEENENENPNTIEEYTANTEDATALDWTYENPEKFVVAILNDQFKIMRDNPKASPSIMVAADKFWGDLSYREIRDVLVNNLPEDKLLKGGES